VHLGSPSSPIAYYQQVGRAGRGVEHAEVLLLPDDMADAVVTVLADWARGPGGWASGAPDAPQRPAGVVTVASRTRPRLISSLAGRIGEVGRMPLLGSLEYVPEALETGMSRTNSAQRVRALHESLVVPPEPAEALAAADGPVLLVDDFSESGWTLAVASRLLRRAGAKGVFPLVLAIRS
jgi:ATP-dependent DNA helicase RecQ